LEGTPAWEVGLRAGDKILAIDQTSTDSLTLDEAVKLIRGEKGTNVTLTIMREGFNEPKDFTIVRDIINVPAVKLTFLDNNIAHLELLNFNENATEEFNRAATQIIMKKSPGIILDLRNNPGGYLEVSVDIAGWFLKKGDVVVREREMIIEKNYSELQVIKPCLIYRWLLLRMKDLLLPQKFWLAL